MKNLFFLKKWVLFIYYWGCFLGFFPNRKSILYFLIKDTFMFFILDFLLEEIYRKFGNFDSIYLMVCRWLANCGDDYGWWLILSTLCLKHHYVWNLLREYSFLEFKELQKHREISPQFYFAHKLVYWRKPSNDFQKVSSKNSCQM